MLTADYLIIGAGAASMAFVDTLLTELPDAKVTIVDQHDAPGGHWNDAYDYVRLHQPSLLYGVSSEQLEGNWFKLVVTARTLPWRHRASKTELLTHYKNLMDKWIAAGKVDFYPNCVYNFDKEKPDSESNLHTFSKVDDCSVTYQVRVREKLVNGTVGECKVPSTTPPAFPVDSGVKVMTPNELYAASKDEGTKSSFWSSSRRTRLAKEKPTKYVVLGAGKTAMDAIVFLQQCMSVQADDIHWVIPNDVWMFRREGTGVPSDWPVALLECHLDANQASLMLEKKNVLTRLDTNIVPSKFRFPVIGNDELQILRNVKNIIRQGRVTAIRRCQNETTGKIVVSFENGDPVPFSADHHVFVHCTSPGPFNGNTISGLFPSNKEMNLDLLMAPPVPISMSCLAVLEARRRKGALDLEFGRTLLSSTTADDGKKVVSDNDVMNALITRYDISGDDATDNPTEHVNTLIVIANVLALLDKDPMVAFQWMSQNRLSTFSIPGRKKKIYEILELILTKKDVLCLSDRKQRMLMHLKEKLEPLKGM